MNKKVRTNKKLHIAKHCEVNDAKGRLKGRIHQ